MKNILKAGISLCLLLLAFTAGAQAQTPELVKGSITIQSTPLDVSGRAFFVGTGGGAGREIWTSDGTPDGTNMVRDLTAGATGSAIKYYNNLGLCPLGSELIFVADNGTYGSELWTERRHGSGHRADTRTSDRVPAAACLPTGGKFWPITAMFIRPATTAPRAMSCGGQTARRAAQRFLKISAPAAAPQTPTSSPSLTECCFLSPMTARAAPNYGRQTAPRKTPSLLKTYSRGLRQTMARPILRRWAAYSILPQTTARTRATCPTITGSCGAVTERRLARIW